MKSWQMNGWHRPVVLGFFGALGGLAIAAQPAGVGSATEVVPKSAFARYTQECSACHVAYPAGFLPAGSWQRVMGGLERHYGTDASIDAAAMAEISSWLKAGAGTYKRVKEEPPENRITRSAWFLRKHRADEVPPEVWKRASVGSPARCDACHTQAAEGRFNERDIRIPK